MPSVVSPARLSTRSDGDGPADRTPDQRRLREACEIEHGVEICHRREGLDRAVGLAETSLVVADHAVVVSQLRYLVVPHPTVGDPGVHEHQRRSPPGLLDPQTPAGNGQEGPLQVRDVGRHEARAS